MDNVTDLLPSCTYFPLRHDPQWK